MAGDRRTLPGMAIAGHRSARHGDSVAVSCRGFDDISAQIAATLQLRNIERYWLVGYSLGGRIAMYHACHGRHAGLQG